MKIYANEITKNSSKKIKKLKQLSEEYIELNKPIWKVRAIPYILAREVSRFKTYQIGNMIGTSETVIKKFEKGEPIDRSKLVTQSYETALNLIYISKYGIELDDVSKMYSPVELLKYLIKLNRELGIALIKDAVDMLNLSYNFNLRVYVNEMMNKDLGVRCDTEIIIYEVDSGHHILSFISRK